MQVQSLLKTNSVVCQKAIYMWRSLEFHTNNLCKQWYYLERQAKLSTISSNCVMRNWAHTSLFDLCKGKRKSSSLICMSAPVCRRALLPHACPYRVPCKQSLTYAWMLKQTRMPCTSRVTSDSHTRKRTSKPTPLNMHHLNIMINHVRLRWSTVMLPSSLRLGKKSRTLSQTTWYECASKSRMKTIGIKIPRKANKKKLLKCFLTHRCYFSGSDRRHAFTHGFTMCNNRAMHLISNHVRMSRGTQAWFPLLSRGPAFLENTARTVADTVWALWSIGFGLWACC